jgi:nitric oxide reductase subunit C
MLSKSQARTFFFGGTIVSFAVFLGLSWHTLSSEVPKQTNAEDLTEDVIRGKKLWEANNCMGCHTIFGEGAYYAPELTKVIDRRGQEFVKAVLMSPTPWTPRGRKMVAYGFSDGDASDLVEFLSWCGKADLNGFPAPPKYKSTRNLEN